MGGGEERDRRSKEGTRADFYLGNSMQGAERGVAKETHFTAIKDCAVKIYKHVVAQLDVVAIITPKWWFHPGSVFESFFGS